MKRSLLLSILVLMLSFVFAVSIASAEERKTRDLVFEDEPAGGAASGPQPADDSQMVVKVKATVLMQRGAEEKQVLPSHEFKTGDKVKLFYTTNVDAYVYWLAEGTSGDHVMLFPTAKTGMDNMVKKNQESFIPITGWFKMSPPAGAEKILLILSPERIPELDEAAKVAMIKGGSVKDMQDKQEASRKSRDLVFEDDENKDSGVSTQTQVMDKDIKQPFVVAFELKHAE
jgi:hypothetical protein